MAKIDKSVGLTDANFIQYLQILATPYDVTITDIDFKNRVVSLNGPDAGMVEFSQVLAEKLADYLD